MIEQLHQREGIISEKQRRREEKHPLYGESRRRLSRIDNILSKQQATCSIEVMGVAHAFSPGTILETIDKADVVTLELIRGIVKKGLDAEQLNILDKNQFWKEIIQHLQPQDRSRREIAGIATNRDARNGVKRLRLHSGSGTLGSAVYTAEVQEKDVERLDLFLSAKEQDLLKKYKWIMVQNPPALFTMHDLWKRGLKESDKTNKDAHFEQTWVTSWLRLVHAGGIEKKKKAPINIAFILPPHPSLVEMQDKTQKILEKIPANLSDHEVKQITLLALEAFLFTPSDSTEAREITYVLDQFIKRKGVKPNQQIKVLHLGGSAHSPSISNILTESLPHNCRTINVSHADDPRIGPTQKGSMTEFFKRNLSFPKAWEIISIVDHELIATDAEKGASMIQSAIEKNYDDFLKRILIERIIMKKYINRADTLATLRTQFHDQNRLYGKNLNDLQILCNKLNL